MNITPVEDLQSMGERELIQYIQELEAKVPSEEVLSHIDTLVSYDYADEADHYEESDKPAGHVFESMLAVEKWLAEVKKI